MLSSSAKLRQDGPTPEEWQEVLSRPLLDRERPWVRIHPVASLDQFASGGMEWRLLAQGASVGCSLLLFVPRDEWSPLVPMAVLEARDTTSGFTGSQGVSTAGSGMVFLGPSTSAKLADMARGLRSQWSQGLGEVLRHSPPQA